MVKSSIKSSDSPKTSLIVSSKVGTGECSEKFPEMFMSLTSSLVSSSEFSSGKSFSGSLSSVSDIMSFSIILSLPVRDVVIVIDSVQSHQQFPPLLKMVRTRAYY